jgi:alpha-glucoside transport system substrate-binding protein
MNVHSKRAPALMAALAASALVVAGCSGDGGDDNADTGTEDGELGGTVSVLGQWSGAEQDSFMAMVAPWEEETGATVEYTGSRDSAAQITSGIASGNLPDIAGLPGIGAMREWYDAGALQPLDFVDFDEYSSKTPSGFADLGLAEDDTLIGIFTKAAVKGLVFYNTATWDGSEPATWDELVTAAEGAASGDTATWCIGLESGATTGWPGTDWIEDIMIRQEGPDAYDQWVAGELEWTSDEVRGAFETFGEALDASHGGPDYIVNTNFGRAANPMFEDPPGCLLHHQASFITDFFVNEAGAAPEDFDFFPFPDLNEEYAASVTGGGDLVGMFNDTPQARSLIEYLLTAEAQQIWVERGGFISANRDVPLDAYPDEVGRRSAEILQNAETFRFDASDAMPAAVADAFNAAMASFAQNQGDLDAILERVDRARQDAASQ